MNRFLRIPLVLTIIMCFASVSLGYVLGGSNFGIGGYPEFDTLEPSKPIFKDDFSIQRYKDEVEEYRDEAEEYLENAANDLKRIQDAMEDAVNKTNDIIGEYNTFMRTGF